MLSQLTLRLDKVLKEKNPKLYNILNNPITFDEIKSVSENIKFPIPEDLLTLCRWKNGSKYNNEVKLGSLWMFPMNIFCPLSEGVEHYKLHSEMNNSLEREVFSENFFPIFYSGGGEQTLIDIDTNSKNYGGIFYFTLSDPDIDNIITSYADSLSNLLLSVIECYEQGVYYIDKNSGYLENNNELENRIFLKNNPNSDYWKFYSQFP